MRSMCKGTLWLVCASLCVGLLMSGCKKKEEPLPPIVIVEKPVKKDVQIYGEYVGTIRAESTVEIHARKRENG